MWALKPDFPPLPSGVALSTSCRLSVPLCPCLQSGHSQAPMSQSSCDQRGHACKVLPRLQGLWSGQPGHTRRTGGGEGWGRHSTPRGRPAPQHPQPRREMSSGAGEHAWVEKLPRLLPLETPLPGSPGPQLVLITLTGSRTCRLSSYDMWA